MIKVKNLVIHQFHLNIAEKQTPSEHLQPKKRHSVSKENFEEKCLLKSQSAIESPIKSLLSITLNK